MYNCTYTITYMCTYIHVHTYLHTYIRTYIHTDSYYVLHHIQQQPLSSDIPLFQTAVLNNKLIPMTTRLNDIHK